MKRRILALLLALTMLMTLMPTMAFAAQETVKYQSPVYNTPGDVTEGISGWKESDCSSYTLISEGSSDRVEWGTASEESWYVISGGTEADPIAFPAGIVIKGDVSIILMDNSYLAAKACKDNEYASAAINVSEGSSLTIYSQSFGDDMGVLSATATAFVTHSSPRDSNPLQGGAGIGGNCSESGGIITINGGAVTAISESEVSYARLGAGIGGGCGKNGSDITINGGKVVAKSTASGFNSIVGAGIGGGASIIHGSSVSCGHGSDITINGGNVTAVSEVKNAVGTNMCDAEEGPGAGIGGGYGGNGSDITINGGVVDTKSICGLNTNKITYSTDNSLFLLAGILNLNKTGNTPYSDYDADHVPDSENKKDIINDILKLITDNAATWKGYLAKAEEGDTLIAGAGIGGGAAPIDQSGNRLLSSAAANEDSYSFNDPYSGIIKTSEPCATGIGSDICINGGEVTAESRLELNGVALENSKSKTYNFGTGIGNGYGEPITGNDIISALNPGRFSITDPNTVGKDLTFRAASHFSIGNGDDKKIYTSVGENIDTCCGPFVMYNLKSVDPEMAAAIVTRVKTERDPNTVFDSNTYYEFTFQDVDYVLEYFCNIPYQGSYTEMFCLHINGEPKPTEDEFQIEVSSVVTLPENAKLQVYVGTPTDNNPLTPEDNKLTVTDRYVSIKFLTHTHEWSYSASGATITATCGGDEICDYTDSKVLTLTASDVTYDGQPHKAGFKEESIAGQTKLPDIYYEGIEGTSYAKNVTAPTSKGTYKASCTVGNATAYVTYVIGPLCESEITESGIKNGSFNMYVDGKSVGTAVVQNANGGWYLNVDGKDIGVSNGMISNTKQVWRFEYNKFYQEQTVEVSRGWTILNLLFGRKKVTTTYYVAVDGSGNLCVNTTGLNSIVKFTTFKTQNEHTFVAVPDGTGKHCYTCYCCGEKKGVTEACTYDENGICTVCGAQNPKASGGMFNISVKTHTTNLLFFKIYTAQAVVTSDIVGIKSVKISNDGALDFTTGKLTSTRPIKDVIVLITAYDNSSYAYKYNISTGYIEKYDMI